MNSVEFQVGGPKATAFWDALVDFDCTEEASQKEMSKRHGCAILVFRQVLKRSPTREVEGDTSNTPAI